MKRARDTRGQIAQQPALLTMTSNVVPMSPTQNPFGRYHVALSDSLRELAHYLCAILYWALQQTTTPPLTGGAPFFEWMMPATTGVAIEVPESVAYPPFL